MSFSLNGWSISRRVALCFALLLGCMFILSGISLYNLQTVESTENTNSQIFAPATGLATDFEREILNARIFFIYHVTIQKQGALDKGWVRYRNAEARLKDLMTLVSLHPELKGLQPSVSKLKDDLDVYGPALQATLAMV